jgi:hypothetical protein
MRASGDQHQRSQPRSGGKKFWKTLGVLAVSVGLLSSTSCARRYQLSPGEYERIEKQEQAVQDLFVYVSKKTLIVYEIEDDKATYNVDGTINTSSEQNIRRIIIAKNTPGRIIDAEDRNGAPLLWVTFSKNCKDKDCAYSFVQAEDLVFRLHSAPEFPDYKPPAVYFRSEARKMKLGKLKSLAEKNDVFLWQNKRGKIFTTDLIVKKRNTQKTGRTTIREGGVD